ncbi:hypothetical protein [Trebonia kvetii]|uniref:hypothetical protein n=1 Tax=Trebonia kvetii TaxID=2480626 RepID=UPI001C9E7C19|nr:hypothetical protein [Trebonia kvetii]
MSAPAWRRLATGKPRGPPCPAPLPIEVEHLSNLTQQEAIELGSKVGALVGLGMEGEEGAAAGAQEAAEGIQAFGDAEEWDVLEELPNDSAAAFILLEQHWAVPLRDAIARAGGFKIGDWNMPGRPGDRCSTYDKFCANASRR